MLSSESTGPMSGIEAHVVQDTRFFLLTEHEQEQVCIFRFFDKGVQACREFNYGGCLGNGNRFETESECELACVPEASADLDLCSLQVDRGACRGTYQVSLLLFLRTTRHGMVMVSSRWMFFFQRFYYDNEEGRCKEFSYGGCKGNLNRFVDRESCDNRCKHKAMLVQANIRLALE